MDTPHFAPPGPLGFGGAPLGNMFEPVDERTAHAALEAAWDSGVRYFDTAPHYGSGLSERRFGEFLRALPRQDFVLSTKVGRLLRPDAARPDNPPFVQGLPFRVTVDYSYDAAMRSVEDSLQRLGLAQIDIAFVHDLAADHLGDTWTDHFERARTGAFRALTTLRDQKVIKAWGLGVNLTEPCLRTLDAADPDVFLLAGRYSLLQQPALETLFPACSRRRVHVVVGGPYNSGILAGGRHFDYRAPPADIIDKRERIAALCRVHSVDIRAAALQFCAAHPAVAAVIPGAKRRGSVLQNAALMSAEIPGQLWRDLKTEQLLAADAPTPL